MTSVVIFGCGPTGLLAAHACYIRGIEPVIFSKKRKSFLFGSQYLHTPIPGLADELEGVLVKYINTGTPEEYRKKTHGKYWDGMVAPEDFEEEHMAWNIRIAYDKLWNMYGGKVVDCDLNTENIMLNGLQEWPLVISTVPRTLWKVDGEEFIFSEGWAMGDAPEHGLFVPYGIEDNTILCDGSTLCLYNRLSKVFGYATVEWPASVPYVLIAAQGVEPTRFTKPLRYAASTIAHNPANEPNWLHVGRYGKWAKGYVVTDAWRDVNDRLDQL